MSSVLEHLLRNSETLGSNPSTKNNNKKKKQKTKQQQQKSFYFLLLSLFLRSEMKTLCMGWVCMWCPLKLPQKSWKLETIIVCTLKVRKVTDLSTVDKWHTMALGIRPMLNDLTIPDLLWKHTHTHSRAHRKHDRNLYCVFLQECIDQWSSVSLFLKFWQGEGKF